MLALLAILSLVAAACGGGGDDDENTTDTTLDPRTTDTQARDEGEPQAGGSVTVGLEAETQNWSPSRGSWSSSGYNVGYALYDPLMARDENGEIMPYLAESLEPNEALDEWTITLRDGVTFHDGTPLNAEALKHNLAVNQEEGSVLAGQLDDVESFEVTGDLTGTYVLTEGNASFADLLTLAPGMPFSPTAYDADPEGFGDNPVGTGPFTFDSWTRDSRLEVSRYDDYWQEGLPYLDSIVFRPIPDEDTRFQSLQSGDIDAMTSLRQSIVRSALDAEEAGDLEATVFVGNNAGGAIFNTLEPPVDDPRVRRGLALALDQEDLVAVLGGTGITPPQTQYFSPDSPFYSEEVAEAWPANDPEQAQQLLQEYIDDADRSDGQSPGAPVSITFNCPPDASLQELAQTYQAMWQSIGVEVELNQVEQSVHIQNATGNAEQDPPFRGDYMVNCWRMGAQNDPYITLSTAFGEPTEEPQNYTNFYDDVVQETLDTLRTTANQEERVAAVEELMMHFTEEVPNIWTAGTATMIATIPEVNNVAGWELPDGSLGEGIPEARGRWGHVWRDQ